MFSLGGCFIYVVYMASLRPDFVTGLCRTFAPNATEVWVTSTSDCARFVNATVVKGLAKRLSGSLIESCALGPQVYLCVVAANVSSGGNLLET